MTLTAPSSQVPGLPRTSYYAPNFRVEVEGRELHPERHGDVLDLKVTMDMDMLRTKTPARVQAELAMFLIGYNLIRTVMFDASKVSEARLEQLSFKSALVRFGLWCARLGHGIRLVAWLLGYPAMLRDLARDLNPDRPGRYEPRVVKRRPKPFPRMQQPREVLREQFLAA